MRRKIEVLQRENKEFTRQVEALDIEKQHLQQLNDTIPDWMHKANKYNEEKRANSILKRQIDQQTEEVEQLKIQNAELNNHVQECVDLLTKTKDKFNMLERMMGENYSQDMYERHLNGQLTINPRGVNSNPVEDILTIPALDISNEMHGLSLLEDVKASYQKKDKRKLKRYMSAIEVIEQVSKHMYALVHYSLLGKFEFGDEDGVVHYRDETRERLSTEEGVEPLNPYEEKKRQISSMLAWVKRTRNQVSEMGDDSDLEEMDDSEEEDEMIESLSLLLDRMGEFAHLFDFFNKLIYSKGGAEVAAMVQPFASNVITKDRDIQTDDDTRLDELIQAIDTLTVERDDMKKGYEEISGEITEIETEYQQELETMAKELSTSRSDLERHKSMYTIAAGEIESYQKQLEKAGVEKTKIQAALEESKKNLETIAKNLNVKTKEYERANGEFETTKNDLEKVKQELSEELATAKAEIEIVRKKSGANSVAGALLDLTRKELDSMRSERDESKSQIEKGKHESENLIQMYEDRINELETTINELQHSYGTIIKETLIAEYESDVNEPIKGEDPDDDQIEEESEVDRVISLIEDRFLWQLGEKKLQEREAENYVKTSKPVPPINTQILDVLKYSLETTKRQQLYLEHELYKREKDVEKHKKHQRHMVISNAILSFS
jgi:chromosome segregation ATPase